MIIKNLAYLRSLSTPEMPDLGPKLYEALQSIQLQATNTEQQANTDPKGQPAAPPSIDNVNVTGQNGHFNVAITDHNQIYRGVNYYVEHDTTPHFTNPQVIDIGSSRNHNVFLGNQVLYWRAYSSYGSSPPSKPAYHGGQATPQPVAGGGTVGAPLTQPSQSSGTGTPGQGLQGPGTAPYRSPTGAPPVR